MSRSPDDAARAPRARVRWCALADARADVLDTSVRWLDAHERDRLTRIVREAQRREFLLCRWLARRLLADDTATAPDDWGFEYGPHGRPRPVARRPLARTDLDLNLSHGGGVVTVTLARGAAVGIDVESVERPLPARRLERFLSPPEFEALEALPEAARADRFWRLWTLKEAYLKALGTGIAGSLAAFEVRLTTGAAELHGPADRALWHLVELRLAPSLRTGLALRSDAADEPVLDVERVDPAG